MTEGSTIRRSPRYRIVVPVSFETSGSSSTKAGSGWTRNMSEWGACLELTVALAPGTVLTLILRTEVETIPLQAGVVWAGHPSLPTGGTLHGVAIHHDTPERRQRLQALLQDATHDRSWKSRIPVALLAQCRILGAPGSPLFGWTGDVSQEGCSLLIPDRHPVGTLVEVTLTMPGGDFTAEATVVWVEPSTRSELTRHGVRFRGSDLARDLMSGLDPEGVRAQLRGDRPGE